MTQGRGTVRLHLHLVLDCELSPSYAVERHLHLVLACEQVSAVTPGRAFCDVCVCCAGTVALHERIPAGSRDVLDLAGARTADCLRAYFHQGPERDPC